MINTGDHSLRNSQSLYPWKIFVSPPHSIVFFDGKKICGSHRYLRELEGENGTVSLRDVSRCAKLFNFFHGSLARRASYGLSLNDGQLAKYAAVLSIAHCYHSRLARYDHLFESVL